MMVETAVQPPEHSWPEDAAGEGEVCSVCCLRRVEVTLARCGHQFCSTCLQIAFTCSLNEGRGQLHCLKCSRAVWPHEVADVVPALFPRYLDFSLRKYLASSGHARYCPAPDCEYACLWEDESGCGEPLFQCRHETCGRQFCYECKRPWHEGNSCQEAKHQQGSGSTQPENPLTGSVLRGLNLKECPACAAAVEKVKDNTCNMVDCGQCGAQFCWLCGRPVSELHFFSPTGCGMYGQRQWSPQELWCLRVWMWALGAPLVLAGSLLLAPVVMVAFHVFLVWEAYSASCCSQRHRAERLCFAVTVGVLSVPADLLVGLLWLLLAPLLGLAYIYILIPVHLLRTKTCCRTPQHSPSTSIP